MTTARNLILGVLALFVALGAIWTDRREKNSECADPFYTALVWDEMRQTLLEDSQYLAALESAALAQDVAAEDQAVYATAAAHLRQAVAEASIVGRMKHPNNVDLKNCHLRLTLNDVLADFDLGQRTVPILGFPVDRKFEIIARFEIRFEHISGVELADRIDRKRDQFLVDGFSAGDTVESARIAKLTRREFTIEEPEFLTINYATSYIPAEDLSSGFFGEL